MTPTGLLFAIVAAASGIGFIASLAKPVWFRFNGGVPRRWKIGATWLLLAAISSLGALAQRHTGVAQEPQATTPTEATEATSDISFETFPDRAMSPQETPREVDVPTDAAKPAEDTADTVIDVVPPPPPPALSLPPVPSRRHK